MANSNQTQTAPVPTSTSVPQMNQIQILGILATCAATSMFAMFCFTVRSFPGGGIRIEGPGGIRLEAQLGGQTIQDQALPQKERR